MDKKCFTSPLEAFPGMVFQQKRQARRRKELQLGEITVRTWFSRQAGITNLEYEKIGILV